MYQVKPGETLESIAADFRTTRQALLQANPGLNGGYSRNENLCQSRNRHDQAAAPLSVKA
ncbi:LysM domain-containing protein [Bacillus licheniformis]|nr:LysM domain-containing protein [Bacillus licheniformis]